MIYATSIRDEDGDYSSYVVVRGGRLLALRILTALAVCEPPAPLAEGDHYREMAGRLRGLSRPHPIAGHPPGACRSRQALRQARRSF